MISKNTAVKANDVTEDVDYEISTLTEAIECSFEEPGDLIFELVDFSYDSDNLTDEGITVYDPVTAERVSGEGTRAYTVHNYSGTLEVKKKILGIDTKIATLSISGEFYYYDDGRVHLYSMTASGTGRLGWSVSYTTPTIVNTDGMTLIFGFCTFYIEKGDTVYSVWAQVDLTYQSTVAAISFTQY